METLSQLAVPGIFAVLFLREVLAFLAKRNGRDSHAEDVKREARQITIEKAVITLADNCAQQTDIFREIHRDILELRQSNDRTHLEIVQTLKEMKT